MTRTQRSRMIRLLGRSAALSAAMLMVCLPTSASGDTPEALVVGSLTLTARVFVSANQPRPEDDDRRSPHGR